MEKKGFDLAERLIKFSSSCIDIAEALPAKITGKTLSAQLVRSSSSSAIHYGEAQSAESTTDFIHKLKVCLKELRETYACLSLISHRKLHQEEALLCTIRENDQLIAIFVASIRTAEKNRGSQSI